MMALADPDEARIPTVRSKVQYSTQEPPGTIIVNTGTNYLYYVLPHGEAIQYRIASGAEYMGWTGRAEVGAMKEWPTWMPTASIMERWPQFQVYKQHGPLEGRWDNPLGARALYLFVNNKDTHPHPRHQRAVGNRRPCLVGLHTHARHGRDRPLWPGACRHSGDGGQLIPQSVVIWIKTAEWFGDNLFLADDQKLD